MAVPRDPNFWKRFSYAVHLDEEAQVTKKPSSEQESWHASTMRKNRHSHLRICLTFWILLFAIIAIIVVVFLVLIKTGILKKIHIGGDGQKIDVDIDLRGWWDRTFGGGGDKGSGSGSGEKGS